jgi:uncharacterized membrane protein YgaE (UPF0421/DUF939 family)
MREGYSLPSLKEAVPTKAGARWPFVLVHSVRTGLAATVSVLAALALRLPESYWAAITTLVITQSSLGAALAVSWRRFAGTAIGAAVGAAVATYFGSSPLIFGLSIAVLGLLCEVARLDRSAYRFAGVALAIVLLVPRTIPAWKFAFNRFAEVSIGIGTALVFTLVWPEKEDMPEPKN